MTDSLVPPDGARSVFCDRKDHDLCDNTAAARWCQCPCHAPASTPPETVDHPSHYGGAENPYETIKVLAAWLTPEQMQGFCLGNAVKYISRAGKKGSALEDLQKARWYLDYAVREGEIR